MFLKRCLNFLIIVLCIELFVLLGNIKMYFDIILVVEKLKCMIVLIIILKDFFFFGKILKKKIKVKGNNIFIF